MDVAKIALLAEFDSIGKAANQNEKLSRSAEKAEKSAGSLEKQSKSLNATLGSLARVAGGVVAAFASFATIATSFNAARTFNTQLSETSTLIRGTSEELEFLEGRARSLAREFGGPAAGQVGAFYQAISAGAGTVEEAATILESANRLALGGVTNVKTGVDALTTAVNAYSATGLTAAEVSDALFVGIKAGKTTADELARSLGKIVPIASSVGVSFDEVVSGIAALTTQGQSTSQATTGLTQVIANIVKPTAEAKKQAELLGLEFDVLNLKAQGLNGFLQETIKAAEGDQRALAKLFGSVEALNAVLAFTGDAGTKFTETLSDMDEKLGATQEASDKMAQSLSQRLTVQIGIFSDAALGFGNVLLATAVPALEFFTSNIDLAAIAIIGLAGTQIPALIAALPTLISLVGGAATSFGALGVAITASLGPWGILAGLVAAGAGYLLLFADNSSQAETATYDAEAGTEALNKALGNFAANVGPASAAAAIQVANSNYALADSAFAAAEAELQKQKAMQSFAEGSGLGGQSSIRDMGVSASAEAEKTEQAMKRLDNAIQNLNKAREEQERTLKTVRIPEVGKPSVPSLSGVLDDSKILGQIDELGKTTSGAAEKAAKDLVDLRASFDDLLGSLDPVIERSQDFKSSQDLINEALAAGVITTKEAAQATELLKDKYDELSNKGGEVEGPLRSLFVSLVTDIDNASDALSSFIGKLADLAANSAFDALKSTGIGNIFGGFFDGIFGSISAKGNVFGSGQVRPFAKGTVLTGPTVFPMANNDVGLAGEAGDEGIMPLGRDKQGRLGVRTTGSQQKVLLEIVEGDMFASKVKVISDESSVKVMKKGFGEFQRKTLPRAVRGINNDPKRIG